MNPYTTFLLEAYKNKNLPFIDRMHHQTVPVYDLGNHEMRDEYIRKIGNNLGLKEVCAVLIYGLMQTEAKIIEAMNDGMHWTITQEGVTAHLYCTNDIPEVAVPLLFRTAGTDPDRYPIKDAKRRV